MALLGSKKNGETAPMARSNEEITLLGPDSNFEGKLTFSGRVHIDGNFKGHIQSKDTLVVGEKGRLEGEIEVGSIIAHGYLKGTINAKQLVELHSTAKVYGVVKTPSLIVERGVILQGECHMENIDKKPTLQAPAADSGAVKEEKETVEASKK